MCWGVAATGTASFTPPFYHWQHNSFPCTAADRQAAFTGVVLHMSPIPGDQETPRVRIRVWSITRQWRHPPSMSAGAGLGAESVLASVLGRTAALPHCRSLPTPGHCTLGLSSAIRSLHFLAVNMTQKLQCSSNKGQQLDRYSVNVTL